MAPPRNGPQQTVKHRITPSGGWPVSVTTKRKHIMKRKLLAAAICTALVLPAVPMLVHAQDATQGTKQDKKETKKLKEVVVTGSLIPSAQIETATPVITITAEDIKKQGFTSLYQALRAQPLATGQVQGQQFQAGFTPGAQTISLLGLPPDFTLFLIDGHPLADYPLLYNGSASFTDISSIPLAMIDRVEIVPGNQSSIYGSAAIAGVVNIILKQHVHGIDFDYQAGGFSDGGGGSQRLQLSGGYDKGRFSMTYGLQYTDQQPIWAFQRKLTASTNSNPNPQQRVPAITYGIYDYGLGGFVDPNTFGANPCANIASQYAGTTVRTPTLQGTGNGNFAPNGYACGSSAFPGYDTLLNGAHSGSAYVSTRFRLNDTTQLYGSLLYNLSSQDSYAGPNYNFWEPNISAFSQGRSPGIIFNPSTGTFQNPFESYSPEEVGGLAAGATHFLNRSYNFYGGLKGSLGQTDWDYDLYYARSQNNLTSNEPRPLTAAVDNFFQNQFMGPQLGTAYGYPVYQPDYSKFYQSLTPAQYQSFLGVIHSSSETYTQNVNLNVTNTDLFSLPAGDVGFAGVLQYGDQRWSLPVNPLLSSGAFWGITGSSGGGLRNNYAGALEFHVPIFSMLSADISARYDHYHNDGGGTNSKPTYKAAFSFRPLKTLLLRANYSTAFREPDMGYVFIGPSGFFQGVTDYYQCELQHPGTPFSQCSAFNSSSINPQIKGTQAPNAFLQPINAKSWGAGVVWSPTSNIDLKADYYDVRISNEVQYQSTNSLLLTDAQCLLGQIPTTSPECQAAFAAISRAPANAPIPYLLNGVTIRPINIARERVSGIISSASYRYEAGRYGEFDFGAQYNVTLKHTLQLAPGAPTYDLLHNPFYDYLSGQGGSAIGPEFKSSLTGTITWSIGSWSTTVTGIRYGKLANYAAFTNPTVYNSFQGGRVKPAIMYNATIRYDLTPDARITFGVQNLFDAKPPFDPTYTALPYYDFGSYSQFVLGRSYTLEFNYRFGG